MPRSSGSDWEQDGHMQYLLKRKRRLEELEDHNLPEAMRRKRQAVKEEARRRPALSISTDLDFDDDIDVSEPGAQHSSSHYEEQMMDEEFAEKMRSKSKRGRRRVRCAMRKQRERARQQQQQQQTGVEGAR